MQSEPCSPFVPAADPDSGRNGDVQVQLRSHLELEEATVAVKGRKGNEFIFFFLRTKKMKNSEQTSLLIFTVTCC